MNKSTLASEIKKFLTVILLCTLSCGVVQAKAPGALMADPGDMANTISGIVTTSDGLPAAFVTVQVKGTKKSVITEEDGSFEIAGLEEGTYELEISLVGYQTSLQKVSVAGNKTVKINIRLQVTQKQLEAVTVTSVKSKFTKRRSDYVAKIPLKNIENPQVYSTVTKELMTEQMVFSVDDAVRNAPGLQKMWEATGRSGDGGSFYNARGFVLQSQLRNGVAGNVTSRIDVANTESIEVIKGPSATLFGSSLTSYGGLINRVTKKAYDKFGGEIIYAGGSYGFNRLSADINTPLDSAKKVLLRVNTAYNYEGSFQDAGFNKQFVLATDLSYKVNDRLSFNLDAEFYTGSNTGAQMIFFYFPVADLAATTPKELGIDYKRSYSSADIFSTSQNSNFFGEMKYVLSDKWISQTNVTNTYSNSDGPGAYFYVVPNSVYTGDPTATGADWLTRADQSTANNQVIVTEIQQNFLGDFYLGRFRNRFVGGLDYFSQDSKQLFYGVDPFDIIKKNGVIPDYSNFNINKLDSALAGNNVWRYPYNFASQTYSAYASDIFNITDNLLLMAALRVDHFDNKGSYDESTATYADSYKQTTLSPKLGIVYEPLKDKVSIFGNYQNGFVNQTGTDYNGASFKPEEANQLEGGVKLNLYGGRLISTISYYNIKVKDLVRPYAANPNFSIQDGTQLSKGFEAEIIANPIPGLNILAGYAYNDSKYTDADPDVEGRRPATAMSPTTANAWISYAFPKGQLKGIGVGFGGNYASENMIVNSVYYGVFTLPAYTILNASIFYDQPKFRVSAKLDNLTNQEYWIGYTTMNPQKLRNFAASISFKF